MKTTRCGRWLVLGLAAGVLSTRIAGAEDPVTPPAVRVDPIQAPKIGEPLPALIAADVTNRVSSDSLATKAVVTLTPATAIPVAAEGEPVAVEPATEVATSIGLDRPAAAYRETDEEAQRRLEAPTPEKLIERHGSIGFLIRQPEPRNFLEIINPFAPDDFGPREREIYNRDPNLRPGASLPRTFINDITQEPVMSLFDWAW